MIGCLGIVTAFSCGILALFTPLLASIGEGMLFGTTHVYDMVDRLGLVSALDEIYNPVVNFFFTIF